MEGQRTIMIIEQCSIPVDKLFRDLEKVSTLLDDNKEIKEVEYDNLVYTINCVLREKKNEELKNKILLTFKNRTDYVALFLPTQSKKTKFENMRNKDLMKMRKVAWGN